MTKRVALLLTLASCAPMGQIAEPKPSPAPTEANACLVAMVAPDDRSEGSIAAPAVSPPTGRSGTTVTIEGDGMPPTSGVMLIALFDTADCAIPDAGRGDHLLGFTTTDEAGRYRITMPWPFRFDPVEGRGLPDEGVALPPGRYFVLAVPCVSGDRSCFVDFNLGSELGGPFTVAE